MLHEISRIVSRFPRYILENWDSVDKVYNLIYNIQHTVKNLLQFVILRGCIAQKNSFTAKAIDLFRGGNF